MSVALKKRPFLLLVGGLPATGKTWFARELASKLHSLHINSDTVRMELGLIGHYDPDSKQQVYDAMLEQGEHALKNSHSLIVDSTFYQTDTRKRWMQLAKDQNASFFFIEIVVPEKIALNRLQQTRKDSEADQQVYLHLKAMWEEIEFPHLKLDSNSMSLAEMIEKAMPFISEDHDARTS